MFDINSVKSARICWKLMTDDSKRVDLSRFIQNAIAEKRRKKFVCKRVVFFDFLCIRGLHGCL